MSGRLDSKRSSHRFPDGFGEWLYELRYGLTHRTEFDRGWRSRWAYTLRAARCGAGIHWPIQFQSMVSYSEYEPPEPGWACSTCGYERLPYRAVFWSGPLSWLFVIAYWLRHPREWWRGRADRREDALCR